MVVAFVYVAYTFYTCRDASQRTCFRRKSLASKLTVILKLHTRADFQILLPYELGSCGQARGFDTSGTLLFCVIVIKTNSKSYAGTLFSGKTRFPFTLV